MTKKRKNFSSLYLFIFFSILFTLSLFIIFWKLYKQNVRYLLNEKIDGYVVFNFNNYSTNKNAQFLLEEIGGLYSKDLEKTISEVNKYTKFLNNIFLLHLANEDLTKVSSITSSAIILGIDAGPLYIPAITQINNFFAQSKNNPKIYSLNAKTKKILNIPDDFNIYLTLYRGMFLVSFSEKVLSYYIYSLPTAEKNMPLIKSYYKYKDELLFFSGNFQKTIKNYLPENVFIKSIENIGGYFLFEPFFERILLKLNILGTGDLFPHLNSSYITNRNLIKYIKPNTIYLCNNNFTKFVKYISEGFYKMQDVDYLLAIKTLLGFDITDILKLCGNEIIIGNENDEYYAVTEIKEKLMLQALLSSIASEQINSDTFSILNKNIYLKNNLLFFNTTWTPIYSDIFISKETFFYSKIPISKFNNNPLFNTSYLEIDARYDPSYNVMLYIRVLKEDIKRLLILK